MSQLKQLRFFLVSFCSVLCTLTPTVSHAQVFTFASSCQPTIGDSVVSEAFEKQCITWWNKSNGNPSFFSSTEVKDAALLQDQDAIRWSKSFNHCTVYNFQLLVRTSQLSQSQLELLFRKQNASYSIRISLPNIGSKGWVQLFSQGVQLPDDFESLDIVFKGQNNSVLVDRLEISSECIPSLQLGQATGVVASVEEVTFKPVTINPNDTLRVSASKRIVLSDEIILKEGSEITLKIDSCKASKTKCPDAVPQPVPPKIFAVYNFLSPNGDGQNDTFYIENLEEFSNAELMILSKTGKVVFHSRSYKNDWDGGREGKGIYTYQLKLKEGEKPLTGELLLVR